MLTLTCKELYSQTFGGALTNDSEKKPPTFELPEAGADQETRKEIARKLTVSNALDYLARQNQECSETA